MDTSRPRVGPAEAALGAFDEQTRALLTPLLVYKSVFLGDWFEAIVAHERDPEVRDCLVRVSRQSLREAIETIAVFREWPALTHNEQDEVAGVLQRRLLEDLLALKAGNNETIVLAAMAARTDGVRRRLMLLADVDRQHADELRRLIGRPGAAEAAHSADVEESTPLGAHAVAQRSETLGANVEATLAALRARGEEPVRIILSDAALRHLRDEGRLAEDTRIFGLHVDVDFGWRGECYAIVTSDRVRLAELMTMREGRRPDVAP